MNAIQKISFAEVEKSAIEKYFLSINLRIDGLSFVIQDQEKKNIHLEAFEWLNVTDWEKSITNTQSLIQNHDLLKLDFVKPMIFVQSVNTMLIPDSIFQEKRNALLYKQYFGIENHKLYSSSIKGMKLLFGVDKRMAEIVDKKWKSCRWNHLSHTFIENSITESETGQDVFLKIENAYFEVVAIKNHKVEAHNYFEFSSSEEFLFNLLSFIKQTNFDINILKLIVLGRILESSPLFILLEKYLPNVVFKQSNLEDESMFHDLITASNAHR